MKKMVLNKKGQATGLPTVALIGIVIGILVLVLVVVGFTTGWGYIFDKIGLLPDDLTAAAAACDKQQCGADRSPDGRYGGTYPGGTTIPQGSGATGGSHGKQPGGQFYRAL